MSEFEHKYEAIMRIRSEGKYCAMDCEQLSFCNSGCLWMGVEIELCSNGLSDNVRHPECIEAEKQSTKERDAK